MPPAEARPPPNILAPTVNPALDHLMDDMSTRQRHPVDTSVFECIRERPRRLVLSVLHSQVYGVSETDLATMLVARREDKPLVAVSRDEHERAAAALHHRHLPKLEASGLVERDAETSTVHVADEPALRDPVLQQVLDDGNSADGDRLDAVFDALADDRRRLALAVLNDACRPVDARTLARRMAAQERESRPADVPGRVVDEVHAELGHVHLAKLRNAGLVHRDDDGALAYEGDPAVRVQWLAIER